MTSFHPTIKFRDYLKILGLDYDALKLKKVLNNLFPQHTTTLVDSGRSALSVAIESFDLEGKTLILPSYLCNVITPILNRHKITPVFLDIDKETFIPPDSSYTEDLLASTDAVLVVATYGNIPSKTLIERIRSLGKIVLEDYAHVALPKKSNQNILGDARYYSLPKMLPVPDGGLLVSNKKHDSKKLPRNKTTLKNWLKLFKFPQFLISYLSSLKKDTPAARNTFQNHVVKNACLTTEKILLQHLTSENSAFEARVKYCIPELVENPREKQKYYFKQGVATARIWHDPIILSTQENIEKFPNTKYVFERILCKPSKI